LLCGSFTIVGCQLANSDTTHDFSPKEFKNLSIHYQYSVGMLPESEIININTDTASYQSRKSDEIDEYNWHPTREELEDLYQIMLDNDFSSIRSSEDKGPVYDRGGVNVTINVDGKETRIDNSGNHFIEEKWQRNFALIS
jgi:hypothetical protein